MTEQELIVLQAKEIYELRKELEYKEDLIWRINAKAFSGTTDDCYNPAEVLDEIYLLINGR